MKRQHQPEDEEPELPRKRRHSSENGEGRGDKGERDPIGLYLQQIGEIPLLTRAEEIALAKDVERHRCAMRRAMLSVFSVLADAVATLKKVIAGELPHDRTVDVTRPHFWNDDLDSGVDENPAAQPKAAPAEKESKGKTPKSKTPKGKSPKGK